MKPARVLAALLATAASIGAARAEPVEFVFVLKDQTGSQAIPDARLVQMRDQTEAECRFETNKAAAAAGSVVVPGSPGVGFAGGSQISGALSNLATAMTATGPTILPGMNSEQMWQFFVSCFEAKGYAVMQMPQFKGMKVDFETAHPGVRVRGIAKTFDFP